MQTEVHAGITVLGIHVISIPDLEEGALSLENLSPL